MFTDRFIAAQPLFAGIKGQSSLDTNKPDIKHRNHFILRFMIVT